MKTLAVYHFKGGVGKTATAVNLSYLAANSGKRTLICDLDPQSSATFYFRIKPKFKSGRKGLIKGGEHIEKNIKGTDFEDLDLLPADFSYRNLDMTLNKTKHSKMRLREVLRPLKEQYEYIILDCPPNINIAAESMFNAADWILIPIIPTPLSVRTYEHLLSFFKKKKYDTSKILTFFSVVKKQKKIHQAVMQNLSKQYAGILKSHIPDLSDIEKMGIHREPVPSFAPKSLAAKAYQTLWEEINTFLHPI